MYFLESICEMSSLDPVWNIVGFIVKAIWIGVPILLVIYGMLDLGKAVMASKEDEIKSAQKLLIKRAIYAVAIFFVVLIVQLVFGLLSTTGDADLESTGTSWVSCWDRF